MPEPKESNSPVQQETLVKDEQLVNDEQPTEDKQFSKDEHCTRDQQPIEDKQSLGNEQPDEADQSDEEEQSDKDQTDIRLAELSKGAKPTATESPLQTDCHSLGKEPKKRNKPAKSEKRTKSDKRKKADKSSKPHLPGFRDIVRLHAVRKCLEQSEADLKDTKSDIKKQEAERKEAIKMKNDIKTNEIGNKIRKLKGKQKGHEKEIEGLQGSLKKAQSVSK